ncbi:hypothetical protein [Helicobacter bilis]|uniref:Uncharacterized protein n=1 Tax=Helicobacter bilis TaxID=37372 RepID=A0A4U8UAG6_9HELI|nr:hypothetical protein [Helicobacter bilis]MCI7411935.1 hypothetical protein [Helicobacter bilis]MDD7297106.1 hypothetical protein [Helicobacter bilis]MDY4399453.1 hypothetical protein [Helicobacter bilis]TLE09047.1 hypothetical protein LS78_003660 [Helicobacter bilis]TLE11188.1 hypothetical protein LS79_003520 [Helicobacter bilis]
MKQEISYQQMLYIMQYLSNKKQIMPKDMLGRSLAYTCFLPRLSDKTYLYEKLKTNTPKKALYTNTEKLSKLIQTSSLDHSVEFDKEILCVIFSDLDKLANNESADSMDYLSMIRRLSPAFVVHESVFIDEYQILESTISGADMIILNIKHLQIYCEILHALESNPMLLDSNIDDIASEIALNTQDSIRNHSLTHSIQTHINKLIAFAYNLGIIPILRVMDTNDLEIFRQIENLFHCFYATNETIDALPKESITFVDRNIGIENLVDILIVSQ